MSFVSPRSSMFHEANARVTLRSRRNKTHYFPRGQSLSVLLCIPPNSNLEKTAKSSFALRRLAQKFAAVSRSTTSSGAS